MPPQARPNPGLEITMPSLAPSDDAEYPPLGRRIGQVVRLFLKLGFIGFGGPAATIAMMEDEVVARRQWLTRDYFLDLIGATNLIPGPNATEIAIHVGYLRAGWPGLHPRRRLLYHPGGADHRGFCLGLCALWRRCPQVAPLSAGHQARRPGRDRGRALAAGQDGGQGRGSWALMGLAVLVASLLGVNEILALFAGGILGMVWLQADRLRRLFGRPRYAAPWGLLAPGLWLAPCAPGLAAAADLTLWSLGLFFLKIGAVMYGSGYVLIAFLAGRPGGRPAAG